MARKKSSLGSPSGGAPQKTLVTSYDAMTMLYSDNSLKVAPHTPKRNTVKPFRRWAYFSVDDEGYIMMEPRPRKERSKAERIKSSAHGSLSKTADGAFLLIIKVYEDEQIDYKRVMIKETEEVLS